MTEEVESNGRLIAGSVVEWLGRWMGGPEAEVHGTGVSLCARLTIVP